MKFFFLIIFLFSFTNKIYCQNTAVDIKLIRDKNYNTEIGVYNYKDNDTLNNKKSIIYKHKNIISKFNPASLVATSVMLFYQHIVSPQFFRRCLYERSCSNFCKKAINEFGLIKGIFMAADRLLRCNMNAINDIPPDQFYDDQLAIDEPSKYHWKKR